MKMNKRVTLMAFISKTGEEKELMKMNKTVTLLVLLLSVSLISQVSAFTGTYVDVTPSNTVALDGSDPWGGWTMREYGNENSIYQGNAGVTGLKSAISGLIPGRAYDIYTIYWTLNAPNTWGVRTGMDPDPANAVLYDFESGTELGPTAVGGAVYEMEGFAGTGTADEEGRIFVYVFPQSVAGDTRTWIDGFSYQEVFLTYNPQPAHGAKAVALDSQLSWSTMLDPCNPTQPNPEVTEHYVYFGETPNLLDDDLLIKVPVSTEQVSPPPLQADKQYYWVVDEIFADGSRMFGLIWTFETIETIPTFDPPVGSQPRNVRATEGETIMFTAVAGTLTGLGGTINYQWYKGLPGDTSNPLSDDPNHISGAQSNELTIVMEPAHEGSYFCRATNDAGTEDSEVATLLLKLLLAWYKFDDNLNDSIGTNNGTMTNPIYVDGMDGKALSFDGSNYVNLGTDAFPNSNNGLKTGSLSFWINSAGRDFSFAGTYNTTAFEVWYVTLANRVHLQIRDGGGKVLSTTIMPPGSILDAWHLITFTWDSTAEEEAGVIYLDGVRETRNQLTTNEQPSEFGGWQYPMLIGARQNGNLVENTYIGLMDDYRVYNYPLDAYEVAELYTSLTGTKICVEYPAADLNQDCMIDQADFEILRSAWLDCGLVPTTACEYKLADMVPLLTAWLEELSAGNGM